MSLANPPPKRPIGIIAASDFDSPQVLEDLLGAKVEKISHVYTNGANRLVEDFAREHGLVYTSFPISGGRGLPLSTRQIIEASEFVLVISTPDSKSARQVLKACEERKAQPVTESAPAFDYYHFHYEPIAPWKQRVCKAREILACMSADEIKDSLWAKAVEKALET